MSLRILLFFLFLFITNYIQSQSNVEYFYSHHSIQQVEENSDAKEGYWMFLPEHQGKDEFFDIVVFMHGYGAYEPMIYGAWIKHIVKQGNIVIFPRYQTNLVYPSPKRFPKMAAKGIQSALKKLESEFSHIKFDEGISYVGHSYGGVIISNLSVNFKRLKIPFPKVALLCAPGSGPLKGGRLNTYQKIPKQVKLVTISAEHDDVVQSEFSELLANTTPQLQSWWYHLYPCSFEKNSISAGHNECYALDSELDFGNRNMTAKKAIRIGEIDEVDHHVFWEIFDDLLAHKNEKTINKEYFTQKWKHIGYWDNQVIGPLELKKSPTR